MSTYNNHLFCLRQQVGSLNRLYRPSPQERGALLFGESGKENASALNIVLTVRPNQAKSKAAESTSLPTALIVFIELVLSQLGKGVNFVELGVTPRVCCAHLSGAGGAAALLRAGARIDDGFPHVSHGALPPDLFVAAGMTISGVSAPLSDGCHCAATPGQSVFRSLKPLSTLRPAQ